MAADVLRPATAVAIRRRAATAADRRMAADPRTAADRRAAADRTGAADMGGNIALVCFPALQRSIATLYPSSETRQPRVPLLFFAEARVATGAPARRSRAKLGSVAYNDCRL